MPRLRGETIRVAARTSLGTRACRVSLLLAAALNACSGDSIQHAADGQAGASGDAQASAAAGGATSAGAGSSGHTAGRAGGASGAAAHGGAGSTSTAGSSGAAGSGNVTAGSGGTIRTESPWGVAPSHSSSVGIASWASVIAETGVDWIRGFDGDNAKTVLPIATNAGFQVSGIFMFSDPGSMLTFPVNSIPAFKAYVSDSIQQAGVVKHWEVWNEPPNFSANTSPSDYAKIVVAAYDATKAADPTVQVGLAAQSVNLNFMAQALAAGAADHFDYVTVHPYETLGLVDAGWEGEYLSIVPTIRKLLADKSPSRQNVPIWFTELGEPVQNAVTPEQQADTLVKAYVMGLAQGVYRIHWFEPLDGDSGPFGLIAGGTGTAAKRPSFTALSKLVEYLGKLPNYLGFVLLNAKHYAFVFAGPEGAVAIAWSAKGVTDSVDLGAQATTVDLHSGTLADTDSLALTHSPILVSGVPQAWVDQARGNAGKPFPWDGDYSGASSVEYSASDGARGLHPLDTSAAISVAGQPAHDASHSASQAFTVDPNFCSYTATRLTITAVLRRNTDSSAGFNLKYESSSGYKGTASWYTIPGNDKWYTQSWTIDDPQFVGKWGYNFSFDSDSTQNSNYAIQSVTVTRQ